MDGTRLERPTPLDVGEAALFLDVDGTIAALEPQPGDVGPLASRTALLRRLDAQLNGRLAVLTGRTLEEADRILEGAVTAAGAVHGLVRRDPAGIIDADAPAPGIAGARAALQALAEARPGLVLEEKHLSLALHYRHASDSAEGVLDATRRIAQAHGLTLQAGVMVSELRTPGPNKGEALHRLMRQPPFEGFKPIMIGDDLTDEAAFAAAADLGGFGILVGAARPSAARYRLENVDAVLDWLSESIR